jgi:hypothetical protein
MAILPQPALFGWDEIEAASDLDRLALVLAGLPDEALMVALERRRGLGRNDYPVRAVWNALLAGLVFEHDSIEALRRELSRNAQLRALCGFDLARGQGAVPPAWAFSRFLAVLLAHEDLVRAVFAALVATLAEALPDLGQTLAADGKALASLAPRAGRDTRRADGQPDRRAEHDATWGRKTYRGTRADGTPWEKVVHWFGFQVLLLVDSRHELPVNYEVTTASCPEVNRLLPLVADTARAQPTVVERCGELAADKGYDAGYNYAGLWAEWRIKPVLAKRNDWQDGERTRALADFDNAVYDQQGRVFCVCPRTGVERAMAPWGFDARRACVKYRCPAVVGGWECAGRGLCARGQSAYGKVVRIPLARDPRTFVPLPRDSRAWAEAYARRTAAERVNSRLDCLLGFERHTVRGLAKMTLRVGLALVVLLAMALGRLRVGQPELLRSIRAPVARGA